MKKTVIAAVAMSMFVGACTTDPYTGEQKISNTAGGAALGAVGQPGQVVRNYVIGEGADASRDG